MVAYTLLVTPRYRSEARLRIESKSNSASSVGFVFWAELVSPFLVFGPRRPRMLAFWTLVPLQALIAATGNYGFFNALAIVLCLSLVEDRDWERFRLRNRDDGRTGQHKIAVVKGAAAGW